MKSFVGFRAEERWVHLPDAFFTELLPIVDDLAELKVTLACWRLLAGPAEAPRFVNWDDLSHDDALAGLDPAALRDGLERAVARGALLRVLARRGGSDEAWYLLNTEEGRAGVAAIQRGEWPGPTPRDVSAARVERPNIFTLYEQAVGLLSPLIADELRDAEATYPFHWIEEAFREAARQNVRSWAYVRKILERRARRDRRAPPAADVSEKWERFRRGEG